VLLALWLERNFTKDQILELYLNRVYFGAGTYGIDAAARKYFGHPAAEATLFEAAMLAGMLKAPSRYNPLNDKTLARDRATLVEIQERFGALQERGLSQLASAVHQVRACRVNDQSGQ
ncbi:MAG: penicillin-binding protein, partial [Oscillochloris sp.]|nr:penicillin-binding protein [Oscillochloris sp.]